MSAPAIDPWLLDHLICPAHRCALQLDGEDLRCSEGDSYPIVHGVPVMVRRDVRQTLWVADESLSMVDSYRAGTLVLTTQAPAGTAVDAAVQDLVAHTNGFLYQPLVNKLQRYPIPRLRLPEAEAGDTLLDVGCGWGRWSIAAALKGYNPVGIDPSLRHALAATRVCAQLGLSARFVVADARYIPFVRETFDVGFSYSVLQHFSKADARLALQSMLSVLKPSGLCFVQMPNTFGIRSLFNQAKRRFRAPDKFAVRYWTPAELKRTFREIFGAAELSVDGFFGLGIQPNDIDMLPPHYQVVVRCSEAMRRATDSANWLLNVADSLYVTATQRTVSAS
ncbi:MAG: hypothetical protein JWN04_3298 [Myxococcaceae bacterium]|nr:hypothetical protein [Myxococcaceae bacterium]